MSAVPQPSNPPFQPNEPLQPLQPEPAMPAPQAPPAALGNGRLDADEVLRAEREQVDRWRDRIGVAQDAPLAALAFSGGGIRSATFGLGVLEALRDLELLRRFDYWSSVSGGGYIMAWLRAHCHRDGSGWLEPERAGLWRQSIAHLSKFSNYLSPKVGLFSADTWTMLTTWMRNAALVQLTIVCGIVLLLLVPQLAMRWFAIWPEYQLVRGGTIGLFVGAVVLLAANQLRQRRDQGGSAPPSPLQREWRFHPRHWGRWAGVSVMLLSVGAALWYVTGFNPFETAPVSAWAVPIAALLMLGALCALPALARCNVFQSECDWPDFDQVAVQRWIVVPMLLTSVELSAVLAHLARGLPDDVGYGYLLTHQPSAWPFQLALAFTALVMLACCSLRCWRGTTGRHKVPRVLFNAVLITLASAVCMLALHAMFCGILWLMHWFDAGAQARLGAGAQSWHAFIWGPTLILSAFASAVTLMIGLVGKASLEGMREWWSRLAAWLWIYATVWNVLTLSALYGPMLVLWLASLEHWQALAPLAGWIGTTVAGLLAANSSASGGDDTIRSKRKTLPMIALEALTKVAPPLFIVGLLIGVGAALYAVLTFAAVPNAAIVVDFDRCSGMACWDGYWAQRWAPSAGLIGAAMLGVALVGLLLAWRVDINEFSLHAFYRSRLARCYLGASHRARKPQNFTQFDEKDDIALCALQPRAGADAPPPLPLHLINCTVNLGGSGDLALHTRHGASFTIGPLALGSDYGESPADKIGYRRHQPCDDTGAGELTLAEAISVSGAAASPNQGFHSSPAVAFMMTLFNVRLGRWFANPRFPRQRTSPALSTGCLLMELFASASERSRYLMISDGGHFDNLGVYELVRRRCALIVAVDAECDPALRCGALGTLIRLCKVDFNADIDIDVSALARDAQTGLSQCSCVVGRIVYRDANGMAEGEGTLVYLKATLPPTVGDASLHQYHAEHPAFPHESTGDQFYGEDQFESYRRLGRHIAAEALGPGMQADLAERLRQVRGDFVAG